VREAAEIGLNQEKIHREDKMRITTKRAVSLMASASLGAVIIGAASAGEQADEINVIHTYYDGVSNDLLTAGLGKTGLGSATVPGFADPLHPTAEELRRFAIYNNYRALIDPRRAAATARFTGQTSSRTGP
jgi:hydroxybutyrate-dimer hydrolase